MLPARPFLLSLAFGNNETCGESGAGRLAAHQASHELRRNGCVAKLAETPEDFRLLSGRVCGISPAERRREEFGRVAQPLHLDAKPMTSLCIELTETAAGLSSLAAHPVELLACEDAHARSGRFLMRGLQDFAQAPTSIQLMLVNISLAKRLEATAATALSKASLAVQQLLAQRGEGFATQARPPLLVDGSRSRH